MRRLQLDQALDVARSHPLFRSLDDDQFCQLYRSARLHELDPGESLFLQDATADRFFLVLSGAVKLYRLTSDGREIVMNLLRELDTVGEAVMFFDKPYYPVNATVEDRAQVLSVSNRAYKDLLRASPDTCFKVMGAMACRLQKRLAEIETLTQQNATQRVVRFLLGLVEESDQKQETVQVTLPVAKRLVAARLAMQPETFSRVIRGFRQRGLIEVSGPILRISSTSALREMACDATSH